MSLCVVGGVCDSIVRIYGYMAVQVGTGGSVRIHCGNGMDAVSYRNRNYTGNEAYRIAATEYGKPFSCHRAGNDSDKGTSVDGNRKRKLYAGDGSGTERRLYPTLYLVCTECGGTSAGRERIDRDDAVYRSVCSGSNILDKISQEKDNDGNSCMSAGSGSKGNDNEHHAGRRMYGYLPDIACLDADGSRERKRNCKVCKAYCMDTVYAASRGMLLLDSVYGVGHTSTYG